MTPVISASMKKEEKGEEDMKACRIERKEEEIPFGVKSWLEGGR